MVGLYDRKLDKDSCGMGFIAEKHGVASHQLVQDGLEILRNLEHRGALGEDQLAGDGAGVMLQIPDEFFQAELLNQQIKLPPAGQYAVGVVFYPQAKTHIATIRDLITSSLTAEGFKLLGWRTVPTDNSGLSPSMLPLEPVIEQFFICYEQLAAEISEVDLYILRRVIENKVRSCASLDQPAQEFFNIPSLSASKVIYKGMLMASQIAAYFLDLGDPRLKSALAVVHQRYSTNTFPSWGLAHPFHMVAHNGEINTIRGNANWSQARQGQLKSSVIKDRLKKLLPVIAPDFSDSSAFDNNLEFLTMAGREIEHAALLMMPQAWENDPLIDADLRAFYQYNAAIMEPWDGPAAITFCDGKKIGAILDRNGLRPIRYSETFDGKVLLASEAGVLDLASSEIKSSGQLGPGEILLVDLTKGEVFYDQAIKKQVSRLHPYQSWVDQNMISLAKLPSPANISFPQLKHLERHQKLFHYTSEQLALLLKPMVKNGLEVNHSMGNDTPLALLSRFKQPLSHYFKQAFAQVTNPAIDSIRESLVMSLQSIVGSGSNILEDKADNSKILLLPQPVLTNSEFDKLKNCQQQSFKSATLDICYKFNQVSLQKALTALLNRAEVLADQGYNLLLLSDRNLSAELAPIPALMAVAAVHHHLIRRNKRGRLGLILETGDVREVHDFACLLGYGAAAVNPYLVFASLADMIKKKQLTGLSLEQAEANYITAVKLGLKKILAKMGVSALSSYQGAQLFEALGLDQEIIDLCFTGTASAIGGMGFSELAKSIKQHQLKVYGEQQRSSKLEPGGEYHWRIQGEYHAYNPQVIHLLQQAAWKNDPLIYDKFKNLVNDQSSAPWSIRGLLALDFKPEEAVALSEVESAQSIIARFYGGAMSIGAISKEAHEAIAVAFNELGARSNTGEGGEDQLRFTVSKDGLLRRSAIKQVASGRFGVTSHYLVNADELQIKIAQGAKPGEGGQLWGGKIDDYIAKLRHTVAGVSLISPPPHHDIYSIEDLSQLIFDLKNANQAAEVSVKLSSLHGVGTVAAGVAKAKADGITISGYDGGTAASPATSIKHAGIPWEIGLAEAQQALVTNNLRSRVKLQVDGQLKTGRDVVVGALLGADNFGFATSLLVTLGCIMMRKCHLNTCPVGVATQNPKLRKNFSGNSQYVKNYLLFCCRRGQRVNGSAWVSTVFTASWSCGTPEVKAVFDRST